MIERTCRASGEKFVIAKEDLKFYAKMGVITAEQFDQLVSLRVDESENISEINIPQELLIGLPTLCPEERQKNRLIFRNLRKLYQRKCDATGKNLVSCYSAEVSNPVYENSYWWGDAWDGFDYGQDFDFTKPFFEQFGELFTKVPVPHGFKFLNEQSEYINGASNCKKCYLGFNIDYCEDCLYLENSGKSTSCVDCLGITNCELGYDLVDCRNCYNLVSSQNCVNCSDSFYLRDCRSCRNCIGCVNLIGKEYYVFNEKVSKSEFLEKKKALEKKLIVEQVLKYLSNFRSNFARRYYVGTKNENSTGDFINNTKNIKSCFDCYELEDCKYCDYVFKVKDSMDYDVFGDNSFLIYNSIATGPNCSLNVACSCCWSGSSNNFYSHLISSCHNCLGCVGLKHKQYCILNKQYTKEEYEELLPKIIAHMKKTEEWGEFFPANMSPFAYNETVAQEYYPLTKEEALGRGYKWKDETINKKYETLKQSFDWNQIPDDIKEVEDDILTKVLFCERSGKPYKIQKAELKFYRKMNLPIPHLHPDERHKDRMKLRNPRKLYERTCTDCQKEIQTTFAPERPEKILCENCYLKVVD
ncbi:hypothetical protein CSB37_02630 [bacterium DOLZORAL124_38_8]|nr:MAG: hypothetical protein CSB37_02630 [bacterium DOLZORAL124_38_8]